MYNKENLIKNNDDDTTYNKEIKDIDIIDPIIRNSLEFYDINQPKIQEILDKIEYIEIINNGNITDQFIFYNSDNNVILKSKYEILSIYSPLNNTWKWSWSVPTAKSKNTFISRKILEYAFTLNSDTDYLLKSILINSKITILNQNQLDIYLALSAMLSKKPFIFRIYLIPNEDNNNQDLDNNKIHNNTKYYYKKIINNPEKKNYISLYTFIIDWNY